MPVLQGYWEWSRRSELKTWSWKLWFFIFWKVRLSCLFIWRFVWFCHTVHRVKKSEDNLHSHLGSEGGQGGEGTAGQDDGANTLIYQILHAEARREAPVTQNITYKMQRNQPIHISSKSLEQPSFTLKYKIFLKFESNAKKLVHAFVNS